MASKTDRKLVLTVEDLHVLLVLVVLTESGTVRRQGSIAEDQFVRHALPVRTASKTVWRQVSTVEGQIALLVMEQL